MKKSPPKKWGDSFKTKIYSDEEIRAIMVLIIYWRFMVRPVLGLPKTHTLSIKEVLL